MLHSIEGDPQPALPTPRYARFVVLSGCLTATLFASMVADRRKPDSLYRPLEEIDSEIQGWKTVERQTISPPLLDKLRPSSYLARTYRRDDRSLGLFIAYYAQQRSGETMHSPRVCLPGNGWEIVKQERATIQIHGQSQSVNRYHIQKSGIHMLVFYWYQSPNHIIADEFVGKGLLIKDAVLGRSTAGTIVRIILPDDTTGLREGAEFARALIPQVQRCFGSKSFE